MFALLEGLPGIVWWGLGLFGLSEAAKNTGQGVDTASNGIVKLAVAGTVLYIVAKKAKVL